jgi:hypothetical protein
MAMPEWSVERAPPVSVSKAPLQPIPDPSLSTTAEAAEAPAAAPRSPPAMKAHLGLFHVSYRLEAQQQDSMYAFCNGASPASSLEKCLVWRASQAAALLSGAFAYAAVILLLVGAAGSLKAHALEYTLAWAWTLFFMGGLLAWGSCLAFFMLVLAFRREHRVRKDGYTVEVGYALMTLAAVGCVYVLLPFVRMVVHKCTRTPAPGNKRQQRAASAPVGEESVEPGSYGEDDEGVQGLAMEEEAGEAVDYKAGDIATGRGNRGGHHHHRPHHHQHQHQHQHHHRRRQSRELAQGAPSVALASVVVIDEEVHEMGT